MMSRYRRVIRVLAPAWAIGGPIGADFSLELRPRVCGDDEPRGFPELRSWSRPGG